MSRQKDGKLTAFIETMNVNFLMWGLAVVIIMKLNFWLMIESRCSRQCVSITMEVCCRVLVCVVYLPWVLSCSSVCCCVRLSESVHAVWECLTCVTWYGRSKLWREFLEKEREKKNKKKKQLEILLGSQLTWVSQAKALVVGEPVTGEWLR